MNFRSLLALICVTCALVGSRCFAVEENSARTENNPIPRISPEYTDVTLPPNIAPINFSVREDGASYKVVIRSSKGTPIEIASKVPAIRIPLQPWKALIAANQGQPMFLDISTQEQDGKWKQFRTITNSIASDPIDGYLAYRLLRPLYNFFHNLGIYQRNIETFEEKEVLANERIQQGCVNCHTFLNNSPDNMAFHVRCESGKPMILVRTNEPVQVARTAGYLAWHPSGKMMSYSVNKVTQFFHSKGEEVREVFDSDSDLGAIQLETHADMMPRQFAGTNTLETWPAWSPDGKYLYYCSAIKKPEDKYREIQYDLMRASYDIEKNVWGDPELLISSRDSGLSTAQPKVSPDGRFLLFCMFHHGHFPAFQKSSDLFLMDLKTLKYHKLDMVNSDQSESWHCWSSNSRWVVFISRRGDGLLARPYFSHVTETGEFSKPFILPQEDPEFYESYLQNYNLPELIIKPITVKPQTLARAVLSPAKVINVTSATNSAAPVSDSSAYQENRTK